MSTDDTTPSVLFVCVHNAGRSQMAAGWLTAIARGRIEVRSAGSEPADQINPVAVDAVRDEIWARVEALAAQLLPSSTGPS